VAAYLPNEAEMGAVWGPAAEMMTQVLAGNVRPADAMTAAVQAINTANHR